MFGQDVQQAISTDLFVILLGAGSAVIDNVPLVAASMGMFDLPIDSTTWHFIAYAAGTGGSMLIIGSAAGVVAMGMEKIHFFWYLKNMRFKMLSTNLLIPIESWSFQTSKQKSIILLNNIGV